MISQGKILEINRCPHCGIDKPHLYNQTEFSTTSHNGTVARTWCIYVCSRCGGVVSAYSKDKMLTIKEMFPSQIEIDKTIPGRAKEYLEQAVGSLSAPAGAVMLAASSVDAMLKEKGLTDGSLFNRINKAAENHLITRDIAKWAHRIRLDANDQRHADNDSCLPTIDDAKKIVEFAQALAQILFVLPARVQRGLKDAEEVDK
jgi:DNA-directed RNA polymerase subunit RPC12/RpoP